MRRVMALAPAFQHRLIGRVLDERVLKLVGHAPRKRRAGKRAPR